MGMKIPRGLFLLWIVALSVGLDNAHATNQHMICKTVESVFSDEAVVPNSSRPQALQGPAGKKGPSGVKGEPGSKGERGFPSTFNPADVENMMETKISAATKELRDRVEILEKKVTELNSTSPSGHQSAGDTDETQCEDGVVYRQKCYFAIFHQTRDVPLTNAQDICERNHGKLADILDREHHRLIHNYMRPKIPTNVWLWLGMLYQISTKTLQWSNRTSVGASLNWCAGYPQYKSRYTNMVITVGKATSADSNCLWNYRPNYPMHGAVCEK